MKRLLLSLIVTSFFVLSFSEPASADPFNLTASCSLPTYVADKCALTIRLTDSAVNTTPLKRIKFSANGKLVYVALNDVSYPSDSFTTFSNAYNIQVACGKHYTIKAELLATDTKTTPHPKVGHPVVFCPAL